MTETEYVAELVGEDGAKIDRAARRSARRARGRREGVVLAVHVHVGVRDAALSVHGDHGLRERTRDELVRPLGDVERHV